MIHNLNKSFLILFLIYLNSFSEQQWIHYLADGYDQQMNMKAMAIYKDDLIVSSENFLTVIKNENTSKCNSTFAPLISNIDIQSIQPRLNGEIWCFRIGNETTLFRFNGLDFSLLDTVQFSPIPQHIVTTIETHEGQLIAGTIDSGVYSLNGNKWTYLQESPKKDFYNCFRPCMEDRN